MADKPNPFVRKHSARYYRNTLVLVLLLALILPVSWAMARSSLPIILDVAGLFLAYGLVSTLVDAYHTTHPGINKNMQGVTPEDVGLAGKAVAFNSRVGLNLTGWYIPGQNRAAVVLVHGLGARGIHMIYHASALAVNGYSVLLFDLRAHGGSEGDTSAGGWGETQDVLGAVDFLRGRRDIDPGKIGVLGLSLGGQAALRAAAQSDLIRAVAAEDPSAASLRDHGEKPSLGESLRYPLDGLYYHLLAYFSGSPVPPGVLAEIGAIAPRPILLISTGSGSHQRRCRRYFQVAGEPKELWEIPRALHGRAYFFNKEEYAQKIGTFFDAAFFPEKAAAGEDASQVGA